MTNEIEKMEPDEEKVFDAKITFFFYYTALLLLIGPTLLTLIFQPLALHHVVMLLTGGLLMWKKKKILPPTYRALRWIGLRDPWRKRNKQKALEAATKNGKIKR